MKTLIAISLLLTVACAGPSGPQGAQGIPGHNGDTCTMTQVTKNGWWLTTGAYITCGASTVFISDGTNGTNGAAGPQGQAGINGTNGANGSDGTSCSVATVYVGSAVAVNGGALLTCTDGTSALIVNGANGTNGVDGATGAQGATGAVGPQGQPGTMFKSVQFCPGLTPTYPTTFAEVGFVIGTDVYGVYSANDGFMAFLPPGRYSSNGINASCNFTINADGTVSQ